MFRSLSAIIHATRPVAVVFVLAAALAAHAQAPPSPPLPPIGPFDRNGKLARGARRVFGIVRTEQGQEFKFEANLWELPPPGNERDPRRP